MSFPVSLEDFELREKTFRFIFHFARVLRPILLKRQRFSVKYIHYERWLVALRSLENGCYLAFRLMWLGSTIGRIREIRHCSKLKNHYYFLVVYAALMGFNELLEDVLTAIQLKFLRPSEETIEGVDRWNDRSWFCIVVMRALALSDGKFFDGLATSGQLLVDFFLSFTDAFNISLPLQSKSGNCMVYESLAALSACCALRRLWRTLEA
eukprot:GEMP01031259.1.p1 GENE.GEMP01031259.1~~GEMP01031259.1.p1  ORF type:complete len:209 (+),score=17.81 GEMP01031259.1:31-657(+)